MKMGGSGKYLMEELTTDDIPRSTGKCPDGLGGCGSKVLLSSVDEGKLFNKGSTAFCPQFIGLHQG